MLSQVRLVMNHTKFHDNTLKFGQDTQIGFDVLAIKFVDMLQKKEFANLNPFINLLLTLSLDATYQTPCKSGKCNSKMEKNGKIFSTTYGSKVMGKKQIILQTVCGSRGIDLETQNLP